MEFVSEGLELAPTDEVLQADEVARELRCSKAHVYNAIQGKLEGVSALPAIPMGRRRLVRRSALEAWKRANEQNAILAAKPEVEAGRRMKGSHA
jgi:excisionase family DNA binding protein